MLSASLRAQPCILYYKLRRKPAPEDGQAPRTALLVFLGFVGGRVRAGLGFQNGDLHQKDSAVNQQKSDERHYALLGHLGTRPRTTYLADIKNTAPGFDEGGT